MSEQAKYMKVECMTAESSSSATTVRVLQELHECLLYGPLTVRDAHEMLCGILPMPGEVCSAMVRGLWFDRPGWLLFPWQEDEAEKILKDFYFRKAMLHNDWVKFFLQKSQAQ